MSERSVGKNTSEMAALVDPSGLYSALVTDLYKQGRNALLDVINLERNGEQLKEGYLNDLLNLTREVLNRYSNASTPPEVLRMLKDLCSLVEDMSRRVSRKQSRNLLERWRAAQKIKDARKKLEQFLLKVNLLCLLLNGQDMAVVGTRLNGISTQILTLTNRQSQQLASSPRSKQDGQQLALRFGGPLASSSRFNILALPPPDMPPIGISGEMSILSSWLLEDGGPPWISVSGMGGVGKTLLIGIVSLLPEVRQHFQDRILWVRLGMNPQVLELHRDLCEVISEREARLLPSPEDGHRALCCLASKKRYLVVLDDAWMAPDSPMVVHRGLVSLNFVNTSNGSRTVVTSRDKSILDRLGVQHRHLELHGLSDHNSYTLFCKHAFNAEEAPPNLDEHARDLARRCGGLPLVLEVVGKAMRSKEEPAQWKYMLHKLSSGVLDGRARVLELLRLSYDQLPQVQRRRFLALAVLDSLKIAPTFLRIAWQCMDLLGDNYKDEEVAECAFNEALGELVTFSLATPNQWLGLNQWIKELAWHIMKEEVQSLERRQEQEEGGSSSTCLRVGVISELLVVSEQRKSPMVLPSLRLLMAHDIMGLHRNMHSLLQLRFLHLDGQYDSRTTASIGELTELVGLSLLDFHHDHKIEEALGKLVKMEYLLLDTCYKMESNAMGYTDDVDLIKFLKRTPNLRYLKIGARHATFSSKSLVLDAHRLHLETGYKVKSNSVLYTHDVDLRFLKRMPNLRRLKIGAKTATSGSTIKHCVNLRRLVVDAHLADVHLQDLWHPKSSLEEVCVRSMPRESGSGYKGSIPATLKSFRVFDWTGGDPTSSPAEPDFSSCRITELSISLPMDSMPESFGRLHSLRKLTLDGCGLLAHLTSLEPLPRLESLTLQNCAMQRLSISSLPALWELLIDSCEFLVEIREIDAPELEVLAIASCKSLVEIQGVRYGHLIRSSQLQHICCASPFSNLVRLRISQAWESLPECLGCPRTLTKLDSLFLDGRGSLLHLPSFARLPRLSELWLFNCAMQCLSLAAGPPGFPVLEKLSICTFKCLVKIQGLYATRLKKLDLEACPYLVEIQGLHCPGLRTVCQSELGGGGDFPDLQHSQNQAATIYRQQNPEKSRGASDCGL